MNDKLMECFTNPVKCKLLLEIHAQQQTTTKQLAKKYNDIPQATLYRYLKKMTTDGVIKIIEEKQVRNVTEKVYAVAIDFNGDVKKMLEENSGEAYMQMFQQYTLGLLHEFQEYTSKEEIDILGDGSGFTVAPIYATKEELESLSRQLHEIIKPLMENAPAPDREMRSLAVVLTPPKTNE